MDARDRVLDAALDLHEAVLDARRHTRVLHEAPACSHERSHDPRPCWEDGFWSDPSKATEHYCAGCRTAADAARERHQARRRVVQIRARLVRAAAALSRTIWATRRAS